MKTEPNNIFANIPNSLPDELFECIVQQNNIVIERIVSYGHTTENGQWYDQTSDEWVILLQGQATLLFEDENKSVELSAGDYLMIPAHTRHRVAWTEPGVRTVWLAVHVGAAVLA